MKRLFIAVILLFASFSVFAQDVSQPIGLYAKFQGIWYVGINKPFLIE
jgi:hypothetical protein